MNRKQLLIVCLTGHQPQNYYVNAAGDDSNPGTQALPWLHHPWNAAATGVAAGKALLPGDTVYLNKGDTFAGMLTPDDRGNAAAHIFMDAYGTGADPIVDGSADFHALFIDESPTSPAYLTFKNIDFSGAKAGDSSYSTVGVCSHDITFTDCTMRDSTSARGFSPSSTDGATLYNVTIHGCTVKDNYMSGIYLGSTTQEYGPLNCIIEYCTVHDNGHADTDHGIYVKGDVTIRYNTCYSNYQAGIKHNDGTLPAAGLYPKIYGNICYSNRVGINPIGSNGIVYNNVCYANSSGGIVFGVGTLNTLCYFNTLVNNATTSSKTGVTFTTSTDVTNVTFKNNIIVQDYDAGFTDRLFGGQNLVSVAANNTIDYNTYYHTGLAASTFATGSATLTFAQWQAYTGSPDAHSTLLLELPDFATNYTDLQPGDSEHNLSGLGVAITGYTTDLNGVTRTSPPTPGAYDALAPQTVDFISGEVGTVSDATVAITFNAGVLASNYSTGVTIKVNTVSATISSATRQTDKRIVYYVLSADVVQGQTVTWEYNATTGDYSNLDATSDLPTHTAQTVTNNVVNLDLTIDHETSHTLTDASNYTSSSGADISIVDGGLNSTGHALQIVLDDTTDDYGLKSSLASTKGRARVRIYFDITSLVMTNGDYFTFLQLRNDAASTFAFVEMGKAAGGYFMRCYATDDAAANHSATNSGYITGANYIEVYVVRASSDVASDGTIQWWLNGVSIGSDTGIDNYDRMVQFGQIMAGARYVDAGTSGTFLLDEIKANDSGVEIGA